MIEISRIDDRDTAKRIERKQIGIARNDHVGMPKNRELQEFVVVRIAAQVQIPNDGHELSIAHDRFQVFDKAKVAQ